MSSTQSTRASSFPTARHGGLKAKALYALMALTLITIMWHPISQAQNTPTRLVTTPGRTTLMENETLPVTVIYTDTVDARALDLNELKRDFDILNLAPASVTQTINGVSSAQSSWRMQLQPKRAGKLEIPVFEINGVRSTPFTITVNPVAGSGSSPSTANATPLTVSLEVDRDATFVNEQLIARITLTASPNVHHLRGQPFELTDNDVSLISQQEFARRVGGESVQVFELVYAIFATKPGVIDIPALTFTGSVSTEPTRTNNFQRGQRIVARTRPTKVQVNDPAVDPAASAKRPWFPATDVQIESKWADGDAQMTVGEPVTRHIRVNVKGQRAAAIPPLVLQSGDFKSYAEQPALQDDKDADGIVGIREESMAIVPQRAGVLTLPPVSVNWWNSVSRRWEVATLPEQTVDVKPAPGATTEPGVSDSAPRADTPQAPSVVYGSRGPDWITWLLAATSALLLLTCLFLWTRLRSLEHSQLDANESATPIDDARAWQNLMNALKSGDLGTTRRMVVRWARTRWPDESITALRDVQQRMQDPELVGALGALDSALYADAGAPAPNLERIRELLDATRRGSRRSPEKSADSVLPQLYPGARGG